MRRAGYAATPAGQEDRVWSWPDLAITKQGRLLVWDSGDLPDSEKRDDFAVVFECWHGIAGQINIEDLDSTLDRAVAFGKERKFLDKVCHFLTGDNIVDVLAQRGWSDWVSSRFESTKIAYVEHRDYVKE